MSRVLLVGKGAPDRGGIPTFLEMLRRSQLADEHRVTFLNVAHSGTPQGGQATLANVGRTLRDAAAVWRAARHADIVHIHSALAPAVTVLRAALLAAAARAAGARVIVHAHGGNIETWLATPLRRRLLHTAMWPAQRVVAVWTAGQRALVRALGPGKVVMVDNGVELEAFPGQPRTHEPPRVLYVGLLTERKGVLDLIAASQLLHQRGVAHELWCVGGTPDEGPAAEQPVRAAASGVARLLGTRPPEEMARIYAEADVFVLPSWWEAMPLSVLEAMASGLPVVATDVGDVSRAVAEGVTGHVVPARCAERLADALEPLLRDRRLRESMGGQGRARVESLFSSRRTAQEIGALYAEVEVASR